MNRLDRHVDEREWAIYALYDRKGRIRYVGSSEVVEYRTTYHPKKWFGYLVLETVVGLGDARNAERKWILAFRATGAPIENVRLPRAGRHRTHT